MQGDQRLKIGGTNLCILYPQVVKKIGKSETFVVDWLTGRMTECTRSIFYKGHRENETSTVPKF